MHNIDEVLADIERLEHKRELAVQRQRERDKVHVHMTGKQIVAGFFICMFVAWVTWAFVSFVFDLRLP